MRRDTCGNCHAGDLQPILDLGTSPPANTFPTTPDQNLPRYPLGLVLCPACGLVQISELVGDETLWAGDYAFYSSTSPMLRTHHFDYAQWLWAQYPDLMRGGPLVEIGCNDGSLLQHLAIDLRPTVGIDPASGPTRVARYSEWAERYGVEIITRPFGQAAAADIAAAFGCAHVVVANNVVAHVADLDDFIGGLRDLLHPDGVAIIEVQYLPDLLLGNDITMVYHEHRSFFSLTTLARTLHRHGLKVTDAWHNDMQGGTLRVEVRHATAAGQLGLDWLSGTATGSAELWVGRAAVLSYRAMGDLQGRADRIRYRLLELLQAERDAGRVVVGYGASAKAVTLANWCGLTYEQIPCWVDTTPAKIGRYLPGTSIPIVANADTDTYLLTVPNYLSRILRQEAAWLADEQHRIILPVPVPRVL
jgi:SAM-dependent methyltransferase